MTSTAARVLPGIADDDRPGARAILTIDALRALERRHAALPLMERAGRAAAGIADAMIAGRGRVVVLAGPGNNGGDACVVARCLHEAGQIVEVVGRPSASAPSTDAAAAWAAMRAAGVREVGAPSAEPPALIVDGLFGIGLARPIAEPWASWVAWANASGSRILALDVPSGLDAATGVAHGPAIVATRTATFIALKPGLLTGDGPDHCGAISVHGLGLDDVALARAGARLTWVDVAAELPEVLERRRRATHKGTFGTVVVTGGAEGMVGAAFLAARAALALGAGRVAVELIAQDGPAFDPATPELMMGERRIDATQAQVVGPGLGRSARAGAVLAAAVAREIALVLDADALNLVAAGARGDGPGAADESLAAAIARRGAATILTPHPAEAARLLRCDTAAVQADRVAAATTLAERFRATAVLKGAGSVVAYPGGAFDINATGNPALSTAGSGDVLSGMLGALLAQRVPAPDAARIAVCLHGAAADALVAGGIGPVGVRASEVIEKARALVNAASRRT
ncbi:MAG: NAD(P)H-hydrate dehydratase, partial [Proteobacteria bacterium]|nr:NAD(P)H-hydrate dehydratase [Pseudomonadota bacterium]MBS0592804.1 NAD(P)H-hydrate dehydratase [Pseudomonadota bacterium]